MGGLTDLLMWLHKRIEEKGSEVGKVHPLAQTFLVSISSRMLVRLSRPIHLLGVHFSRFDMLTPFTVTCAKEAIGLSGMADLAHHLK